MANPTGNHYLYRLQQRLESESQKRQLLTRIGTQAVNHFQNRITEGVGIDGKPFAARSPEFSNREGRSVLLKRGNLRRSIRIVNISGNVVTIASRMPYSELHNDGGEVEVTPKMKKFFWAKYYEAQGKRTFRKKGTQRKDKRNKALNRDARNWKSLALRKVGSKLKFKQRQYMGRNQALDTIIKNEITQFLKEA